MQAKCYVSYGLIMDALANVKSPGENDILLTS